MKKLTALLLALTMIFMMSSCAAPSQKSEPEPEEEPVTEEEPEPEEEPVIEEEPEVKEIQQVNAAVFSYDYNDYFDFLVLRDLDEALSDAGIEFTDYDGERDQEIQNDEIDEAIADGANLLIVNIVDTANAEAAQKICDKAKAADIPVIFFTREVSDSVIDSYDKACFVGMRADDAAESQGRMIGRYLLNHYDDVDLNGDGKISYILMKGEPGTPEAETRSKYAVQFCNDMLTAEGYPEIEYFDPDNFDRYQRADWNKAEAFDRMNTALIKYPMDGDNPIELVICNNDDMAIGSVEALSGVGWNTGEDPDRTVPVFGIDFTPEAQARIEQRGMTGSVLMSYTGVAKTIARLARNVQEGLDVFDNTEIYNVDDGVRKIRVPFEIIMRED